MAVVRHKPTCSFCGKPIAKAIHKDYSGLPYMFRPIGDSFIGWEYKECNCKGAKAARKKIKESVQEIAKLLAKDENPP